MNLVSQAQVRVPSAEKGIEITAAGKTYTFLPVFRILYNERDPAMALKPAGIKNVEYNVLTWKVSDSSRADFVQKKIGAAMAGDGFDDRILRRPDEWRTANIFNAGISKLLKANATRRQGDTVFFSFPTDELQAYVVTSAKPFPILHFSFKPAKDGFYSVGYEGAPRFTLSDVMEIWQPLIWQERRIPDAAYLTPAFMTPVPTTMVYDGKSTLGVLAAPEHLPFQPLPMLPNSRFGISVRNEQGRLQPQLYAPIPGGYGSKMKQETRSGFQCSWLPNPGILHILTNLSRSRSSVSGITAATISPRSIPSSIT